MSDEIVAWEMEVKSPLGSEYKTHLFAAEDVPDDPWEAWRDDHDIRNVRGLVYAEEGEADE